MITILDYGLGNIQAFCNIYRQINVPFKVANTADQLIDAERIILPGVGAFDWAMERLQASGMRECLDDLVIIKRRPVLGVCVGMQMMAKGSDEGSRAGLDWISGHVRKLQSGTSTSAMQLPHMGWNDAEFAEPDALNRDLPSEVFYFLHSYHFVPGTDSDILATTSYPEDNFVSVVKRGSIYGVQFHPEKSHAAGVKLLRNFAEI